MRLCGILLTLGLALSGCKSESASVGTRSAPANRAAFVRTSIVQPHARDTSLSLTGEVQARFRADLSFRVNGRVIARLVDVGAHVNAGDVLARLDPAEQQAEFDAAAAAVEATESQLRVARASFERQSALISNGFTTRIAFDNAREGLQSAESSFEAAKAQLGTAKDALGYTELRAGAAGVITARNLEVGQVVRAAQRVFTLAQDGERDAVFDVPESMFFGEVESRNVALTLVADPHVTASGHAREVAPAVDQKTSTVRVKVAIENPPSAMTLGSAVAGTAKRQPAVQIMLPWTALMATESKPAVWIVDPATKTVSLKPVTIARYETEEVAIRDGLEGGERVVVDGGKLLSTGESVTYEEDPL